MGTSTTLALQVSATQLEEHSPQTGIAPIQLFRIHKGQAAHSPTCVWGGLGPACVCSLLGGSDSESPSGLG